MTITVTFDTLEFVEELKASGFDEVQAKGMVGALKKVHEAQLKELATKGDVATLRTDMRELEYRIIIRLGGIMIAGFSALAVLIKLQ
ncbi:MAG: CCDC90 family protein [Magnetococcus sp. DMHC-1]|nr:DUF1640 domain-containing protein [Magnetococcales bacterium]